MSKAEFYRLVVDILNTQYIDGVDQLIVAQLDDNGDIIGRFRGENNIYNFKITDEYVVSGLYVPKGQEPAPEQLEPGVAAATTDAEPMVISGELLSDREYDDTANDPTLVEHALLDWRNSSPERFSALVEADVDT